MFLYVIYNGKRYDDWGYYFIESDYNEDQVRSIIKAKNVTGKSLNKDKDCEIVMIAKCPVAIRSDLLTLVDFVYFLCDSYKYSYSNKAINALKQIPKDLFEKYLNHWEKYYKDNIDRTIEDNDKVWEKKIKNELNKWKRFVDKVQENKKEEK